MGICGWVEARLSRRDGSLTRSGRRVLVSYYCPHALNFRRNLENLVSETFKLGKYITGKGVCVIKIWVLEYFRVGIEEIRVKSLGILTGRLFDRESYWGRGLNSMTMLSTWLNG